MVVVRKLWRRFWSWYEKFYHGHVILAASLFTLQLVHLLWLTTDIVLPRLGWNITLFSHQPVLTFALAIVDYTEIPALLSVSLLYLHNLQQRFVWSSLLYLFLVNMQWVHLFWLTDEVVLELWRGRVMASQWSYWLAWVAIGLDYLEVPVILATLRKVWQLRGSNL